MPASEVSEFLLRACHDLRSSVRAIRAHAELLAKGNDAPQPADFEQRLAFIAGGAQKIDQVVDGLSAYALALEIDETSFTPVPMEVLLRTALAKLAPTLRSRKAQVTYDHLPTVPGNADRLLQLWENLLLHALAHSSGNAPVRIHVGAEVRAAECLFGVHDNGSLDAADAENLFRPFSRTSGGGPEGLGLGLPICRAIVIRHGGEMRLERQADGSSTIRFTLPAER
ncbi:MAG: ATP-binding protein [Candidatus Sulfopaludibacter sp.]|nr:ATP-binding protein [Candidatus Sulfopaludibacter sp.]